MTRVLKSSDMRCSVTGKRMYVNEEHAEQEIANAWQAKRRKNLHGTMPIRAFLCEHCNWWHLTSRPHSTARE